MNTQSRPTMPTRRHALRLGAAAVASALIGLTAQRAAAQGWRSKPVTLVKAGTVKLFGVTTAARLKTLPGTPTLAEQGLKGFDVVVWHGIYAPKGTPKEAVEKFGAALKTALKDPAVVAKMDELGAVIVPEAKQTPAGLQTWLQQETARYAPVIKAAGQFAD